MTGMLKKLSKRVSKTIWHRQQVRILGYQEQRHPEDQYTLITATDEYKRSSNSLEIGCNQGMLVSWFSKDGLFSVGLDGNPHWESYGDRDKVAIFGLRRVTVDEIMKIPEFDIVLCLSVHHQWVCNAGDEFALDMLQELYEKARYALFVEFSALSIKYGYSENEHFLDNDEKSVVEYAKLWLRKRKLDKGISYLGATREKAPKEPYRYLFMIRKKPNHREA